VDVAAANMTMTKIMDQIRKNLKTTVRVTIKNIPGAAVAVNELIARISSNWKRRALWKHITYILKREISSFRRNMAQPRTLYVEWMLTTNTKII
jgi:hypothetical protein